MVIGTDGGGCAGVGTKSAQYPRISVEFSVITIELIPVSAVLDVDFEGVDSDDWASMGSACLTFLTLNPMFCNGQVCLPYCLCNRWIWKVYWPLSTAS